MNRRDIFSATITGNGVLAAMGLPDRSPTLI